MTARKRGVTWNEVCDMARALADIERSTSYGTEALKVKSKLMARLKEDGESMVLLVGFDEREILIEADPDVFFTTDHYRGYPTVLIHLSRIPAEQMRSLLAMAHAFASTTKKRRRKQD